MTAYFDTKGSEIYAIEKRLREIGEDGACADGLYDKLRAIEEAMVYDCTLCAEWPGCPEDIRDAIHEVILRHGVETLPPGVNHERELETFDDHVRSIGYLCMHLHTVFHNLAHRQLDRFSDDPRVPARGLAGDGDDRRARMRPVPIRYWRNLLGDVLPEERGRLVDLAVEHARDYAARAHKNDRAKIESYEAEVRSALTAPYVTEAA